jgi:hypothetical protein
MTCSICASIPNTARANTGRDEHFDPPITDLKRHDLSRSDDLWECPECGAIFLWRDDTSWTGSGNNDEEVLTRFSADETALLRAFLHRAHRTAEEVAREAARWLALPEVVRGLVSSSVLRGDRELARALVPRLLDEIARGSTSSELASSFVKSYASAGDAAFVMSELSARPVGPALDGLRAHFKRTLCSHAS